MIIIIIIIYKHADHHVFIKLSLKTHNRLEPNYA